ncbi:hypothetical protein ABEB36_004970 [Hypothenemus hampei]|uniref:RAE1/2 domain-containing protein n=1 Tax=Hypothenemus hampei TaxID=57062 RepID=A0ABD1EX30_HYPHA
MDNNQLPTKFDLIVIGTGLIESILSAAASRIGKTVLHIDSNDYYGCNWASFNLQTLHNFTVSKLETDNSDDDCLRIGNNLFDIKNFKTTWHFSDAQSNNPEETEISVTQEDLLAHSRRFNIDLVPKIHYARGDFVQLLISSNIARYVEYRSVSRVLTYLNGQLEVVPCSRSDVFANNKVSVIEKRMLMKLLTSLEKIEERLQDENQCKKSFFEFLKDERLSPSLIHYVLYAMARCENNDSVKQGIESTKRFLHSLGRFGKTPFLFSLYGSGETAQAFCRLSAVFGAIFALNQTSLKGLKTTDEKLTHILNGDQEIFAEQFVLGAQYAPQKFMKKLEIQQFISRAVFITDRSLLPSEQEHLTLLMFPPEEGKNLITIIEMGHLTGTCPKGFYLVHLTSKQISSPHEDFQHVVQKLFNHEDKEAPAILWSCYFSLPGIDNLDVCESLPENLFLCSGPDLDLDYDASIKKAKEIFIKMYPDLEFLPRAPDPEEIIIGDDHEAENKEEDKSV